MKTPNPCPFCGKESQTRIEIDEYMFFPDEIYLVISRCCDKKTNRYLIGRSGSDLEGMLAAIERSVNNWNGTREANNHC